jgi:hypothetical protein
MQPGLFLAFSLCVGPCWVVTDNIHLHVLPNVTLNVEMFPYMFGDTFGFDSGSMVVDPESEEQMGRTLFTENASVKNMNYPIDVLV